MCVAFTRLLVFVRWGGGKGGRYTPPIFRCVCASSPLATLAISRVQLCVKIWRRAMAWPCMCVLLVKRCVGILALF